MPVSRRTGRRYAAGSHASFDGYEDCKTCAGCGERIVMSHGRALWFENTPEHGKRGFHFDCYPRTREELEA